MLFKQKNELYQSKELSFLSYALTSHRVVIYIARGKMQYVSLFKTFFTISLSLGALNYVMAISESIHLKNKIIPQVIVNEAGTALSHYPELEEVAIEFKFKPSLKKSFMKAQPKFSTLFKPKKKRSYVILMSETFKIDGLELQIKDIPENVMIGWLGHELGHIMDYHRRNSLNLILFGLRYSISQNFIREAERVADTYAVTHSMKDYILDTKKFILNNSSLSEKYKARIRRLYLSPDEILLLVKEQETK